MDVYIVTGAVYNLLISTGKNKGNHLSLSHSDLGGQFNQVTR